MGVLTASFAAYLVALKAAFWLMLVVWVAIARRSAVREILETAIVIRGDGGDGKVSERCRGEVQSGICLGQYYRGRWDRLGEWVTVCGCVTVREENELSNQSKHTPSVMSDGGAAHIGGIAGKTRSHSRADLSAPDTYTIVVVIADVLPR